MICIALMMFFLGGVVGALVMHLLCARAMDSLNARMRPPFTRGDH